MKLVVTNSAPRHEKKTRLGAPGVFVWLVLSLVSTSTIADTQAGLPEPSMLLRAKAVFRNTLLAWYRAHRRALPWRESPSVYKTVVSELMLQQTQVKTVLPYFARWLAELPDFAALAAAPESRVLKLWEGLGYYSRARNLHRLAKTLAAWPEMPRTPEAWLGLPGVGPYTAAAVTSIVFGAPAAVVDGNVVRILARLTADATEFRAGASAVKNFTPLAQTLLNRDAPGDHNQAMMELGATVCFRQNPRCTVCPVRDFCAGRKTGAPENFPRLAAKKMERVEIVRAWCVHDGKLLLHRAATSARRLAELHELPGAADLGVAADALARGELLAKKKRGITRYQITETIHAFAPKAAQRRAFEKNPTLQWVPLAELGAITLSGPHRRWVTELLTTMR
jgi:A/G-specific adenine glycosylase